MERLGMGCCGAYCATCQALLFGNCRGCRYGYDEGRDLRRARCEVKRCCLGRGFVSCADCETHRDCLLIAAFFARKDPKYRKFKAQLDYVRQYGYDAFFTVAADWKNPYGPLPKTSSSRGN